MKKFILLAAFFILMEYQVLFHFNPSISPELHILDYSLLTGVGLIALSFSHLLSGLKGFNKSQKKKSFINKKYWLPAVVFHIFMLSIAAFYANSFEHRFIMMLIVLAAALISFSIYEVQLHPEEQKNSRISAFTIPIIFIYAINFLLAVQIDQSLAYQFILLLSIFVLYDLLHKEEQFALIKVNQEELRHYLFHRWGKYFNFFLGSWYCVNLYLQGTVGIYTMLGLLFLFTLVYLTIQIRVTSKFKTRFFVGLLLFSAVLTGIPAAIFLLTNWRPEAFIVSAFIFLGFDLGDIYWHNLRFGEDHNPPTRFWLQKAGIYVLILLFIWQLQEISLNPLMDFDAVYTSTLDEAGGKLAPPTIQVPDTENSIHIRGE